MRIKSNAGMIKKNSYLAIRSESNPLPSPRRKAIIKALNHWQLYLMLLPALIYLFVFAYKPMYGIQIAFRDFKFKEGITGSDWVGLYNFSRLFKSYWFPVVVKNTLTISVLSLLIGFPFPIIFALALNEVRQEKLKSLIQTVSYAPHFISTVVICGMLLLFMNPDGGLFNVIIGLFGGEKYAMAIDPKAFKWYYVFSGIWQSCGWSAIIYFAALAGVDKSLLEAAELDGASRLQRIWHINLPVLIPTIVIQLILQAGQILNVGYEKILLLQNSLNLSSSEIISSYVYKVGLGSYDYSFSTAASIFNSVVNIIILITVNYVSKKVAEESLW